MCDVAVEYVHAPVTYKVVYCRPQRDMHETAQQLVANNFTLFFDLNSDGEHASYLHTIVMLSEPRGNSDYYDVMMPGAMSPTPFIPPPPPGNLHPHVVRATVLYASASHGGGGFVELRTE